jgi:NitT/TauT family transport system substrate-binding protein
MSKLSRSHLLTGAAAAVALTPRPAAAQTLEKIRFTGVVTDDLTPMFYAVKNGLYQRAGIDLEIVPASSGSAATQAVVAGTYEIGKGSLIASMAAHLRGLPLVIIGNGVMYDTKNPFTLALVAADSPVKNAVDLNGKTCASAALNDLSQLALTAWIDKNGGDSKTVRWVEIPNSVASAALEDHRVDAQCLNEPQLSASLETGKTRVLARVYDAISTFFVGTVLFAQSEWAAKHADVIRRWVRVTYEAATYTNAHHAETAPMMAEITKIPLAVYQKMTRVTAATTSDPNLIQPAIEVAARYKNIPRAFPAREAYFR